MPIETAAGFGQQARHLRFALAQLRIELRDDRLLRPAHPQPAVIEPEFDAVADEIVDERLHVHNSTSVNVAATRPRESGTGSVPIRHAAARRSARATRLNSPSR